MFYFSSGNTVCFIIVSVLGQCWLSIWGVNVLCLFWQASEDLENPESLAQIAASQNDIGAPDGETYIEKYIRGVSAVESILTLDRLRQVLYINFDAKFNK